MATQQQQLQKAIQIATAIDAKKKHIKSFAIFSIICAVAAINLGAKEYDGSNDFIGYFLKNYPQAKKYIYYAIGLAGLGLLYCAYQLYPLVKIGKK